MTPSEQIEYLISHPEKLLLKKPFTRGGEDTARIMNTEVYAGEKIQVRIPDFRKKVVPQMKFMAELDPNCHDVLFDQNVPSITAKTDRGYVEIEFKKMAIPFQRMIVDKHVLHLCGYGMQHTLVNTDPSEQERMDFATFKKYWKRRNQNGMRTKMVATQESFGDAGLLYYFDRYGRIKSRLISYEDGYVICTHKDDNGDTLIESVYYCVDNVEHIDSWDDTYHYRHVLDTVVEEKGPMWRLVLTERHGFSEIPLVTKRGEVGWNSVQTDIEVYEIIYNIFMVIQKRHGWGVLYIKGAFADTARKIAGAVVLNDRSMEKDGDAKYLTPPNPEGMLETLDRLEETIQKGSGCTFILPKDVTTGADISGVAIQVTQSLDNERALQGVIEWQNVADKMTRLFKEGLAIELVSKGVDSTAITRFEDLDIIGEFKVWRPRNDIEYNQMLGTLTSQGILSKTTGIEKNTESTPDELQRIQKETELAKEEEIERLEEEAKLQIQIKRQTQNQTQSQNNNTREE